MIIGITPVVELVEDNLENENHESHRDNPYMTVSKLLMHHAIETIETAETAVMVTIEILAIALHLEMLVAPMLRDSDDLS